MKRLWLLILLTPITLISQIDSTTTHYGFVVEFTGATIDEFGMRLRLSQSSQLLLTTNGGYFTSNVKSSDKNRTEKSLKISTTYETSLYKIESATLFLSLGLKFNTRNTTYPYSITDQYNVTINELASTNTNALSGIIGLGAQYDISKRLALFCHQNLEIKKEHSFDSRFKEDSYDSFNIEINYARLGLTIYF